LDIGVWGYIGIVQHKEHPPEVWHVPPGTLCIVSGLVKRHILRVTSLTVVSTKYGSESDAF